MSSDQIETGARRFFEEEVILAVEHDTREPARQRVAENSYRARANRQQLIASLKELL
jgi:hypothetical protein